MTKKDKNEFMNQLHKEILALSGIDILIKTRNERFVEYRSLFIKICDIIFDLHKRDGARHTGLLTQHNISGFLPIKRSNVCHILNKFDMYLKTSKFKLKENYDIIKSNYINYIPDVIIERQTHGLRYLAEAQKALKEVSFYIETKNKKINGYK